MKNNRQTIGVPVGGEFFYWWSFLKIRTIRQRPASQPDRPTRSITACFVRWCADRLGYIFGFQDALLLAWLVNIPAWPGLLKNLEKVELIKTTTEHNKIPLVRHVDSKWYGTLVYPQGWDSDPAIPKTQELTLPQIIYKYKKLSCESTNLQVK